MSQPALAAARTGQHRDPILLLKALKRAGRIPNYRVSIDDAYGPDHDKTFVATGRSSRGPEGPTPPAASTAATRSR